MKCFFYLKHRAEITSPDVISSYTCIIVCILFSLHIFMSVENRTPHELGMLTYIVQFIQ